MKQKLIAIESYSIILAIICGLPLILVLCTESLNDLDLEMPLCKVFPTVKYQEKMDCC